MDLDIPNFRSFPDHLEEKVKESDVLVAFIGPTWLDLLDERASEDEPDFLVGEIAQALGQGHTMVATVCIDDAEVPLKQRLPAKIQDMLDFQIPNFQDGDDFLVNIGKVMDDIEREYVSRGFHSDRTTDLDKILHLPFDGVEDYVFGLLEDNNTLRLEKHLRDFPDHLLDKISSTDGSQDHEVKTLIESGTVFGIVFIKYGQFELYQKYVSSLQVLFGNAYQRFSHRNNIDSRTSSLWSKLLRQLYYLGALLIAENKHDWLSNLVIKSISWESGYYASAYWIEYMQEKRSAANAERNYLLGSIVKEIKAEEEDPYFYRQFSRDEEMLTNYICQCDFIHCLFVDADIDERNYSGAWPYFGLYYLDRIVPILERMIKDVEFRYSLLGCHLSDTKLASNFARYCVDAHNIQRQSDNWMRGLWNGSVPQTIVDFLNANLTEDEKTRLRFR